MGSSISRRGVLKSAALLGSIQCLGSAQARASTEEASADGQQKGALTASKAKVEWPLWDDEEANQLLEVLNSGHWGRTSGGKYAKRFESAYAARMKAKFCIATSSGTTALLTTLGALGIGPGDEVIMPPYTFVATFNSITASYALPVFADSDIETFQIDPATVAERINENTRLVLPVHIGGSVADLDAIGAVCKSKSIPWIEDACQAPLAEWNGSPIGTHGLAGCISFQASKNITSGEGGAVLTNDEGFANLCYNFHTPNGGKPGASLGRGSNFRLTEFQSALLAVQLARSEQHAKTRDENANYLTELLKAIPGIAPAKLTKGCTRSSWHLYMFRYDKKEFGGKSRTDFLKELNQAGVAASSGYGTLNKTAHVQALANNRHYRKIYGDKRMDRWMEMNRCPVNDRLCEEAIWLSQHKLLESKNQMEAVATAIRKIQKNG